MEPQEVKEYWHSIPPAEKNKIIGDAIDAWLDRKFAAFGKWALSSVAAAAFGWLVYFLLTHGGIGK